MVICRLKVALRIKVNILKEAVIMILSVKDIRKSYGKEEVLKGITFEIEEPEIIALVGPNGSGKSTLLNIITNLISADKGEVMILEKSNKDPDIFRNISFMQDNTVLYDYMTGYDHLQFIAEVQKLSEKQLKDTAERIGITSYLNKKVKNYSLGMKQHLLLAMAVINNPKLLILDEPLNGLDPTSAIRVRELLLALHREGTAILLSSHNLSEIDRVTSKVLFLKKGSLIQEDMSEYEEVHYQISVDDFARAKNVLLEKNILAGFSKEQIYLNANHYSLNRVLQILEGDEIAIHDIEKKTFGSEDRYRKIFSDQLTTSK